jgi:hypothetical protein
MFYRLDLVRQQGVVPDEVDRNASHRSHETSGRQQQVSLRFVSMQFLIWFDVYDQEVICANFNV